MNLIKKKSVGTFGGGEQIFIIKKVFGYFW